MTPYGAWTFMSTSLRYGPHWNAECSCGSAAGAVTWTEADAERWIVVHRRQHEEVS